MRFLFWLVLGLAVIWLLRSRKSGISSEAKQTKRQSQGEVMLRCTHCGLYFPASEAILDTSSAPFCCEMHRAQYCHRP